MVIEKPIQDTQQRNSVLESEYDSQLGSEEHDTLAKVHSKDTDAVHGADQHFFMMDDSQLPYKRRKKKRAAYKRKRLQPSLEMYENTLFPKKKKTIDHTMSIDNSKASPRLPQFGTSDSNAQFDSLPGKNYPSIES